MKFIGFLLGLLVSAAFASPQLNLLDKANCGSISTKVDESGIFNLTISVRGQKGFQYNCSTKYNPEIGHAESDCVDWAPKQVLDGHEVLDITLKAWDSSNALATCMQWQLTFNASEASQEAWVPSGWNSSLLAQVSNHRSLNPPNGSGGHEAGRKVALWQHIDSMTHLSHRCVPKNTPNYWPIWKWFVTAWKKDFAFPPTAHTVLQMRLSHALLASTGVIWSIDRACRDDVHYKKGTTIYESCIGTTAGLPDPHCHLICNQTWSMGPGGIAKRGFGTLSHHIPSPGISIVEYDGADDNGWTGGGVYGDTGCGQATNDIAV